MARTAAPRQERRRFYGNLAWTWPLISPPEEYEEEAGQFLRLLRTAASIDVREVLHLGCGGGHVDSQLKRHLRITGVDLSPAMLRLAQRLNPEVTYRRGDMRTVRLDRRFDGAIISDAVGYMQTPQDLTRAFDSAFRHLKPGGAFVTYAELTPDRFEQNWTEAIRGRRGRDDVVLVENRYDPDPRDTTFEATFLFLLRRGGRLAVEADRHVLGLFPEATWRKCLREAGLRIVHAGRDASVPSDTMVWFAARKPA